MLTLSHIRNCTPTDNPVLFLLTHLLTIEGLESINPDLSIETLFSGTGDGDLKQRGQRWPRFY
jgi:hypothetical protein